MAIKKKIRNGYILAGGKSTRMGEDKGLRSLQGKAMIEYVIAQLSPVVDDVIIVSNNPAYEKFGYQVFPDIQKDKGPAGGIHVALDQMPGEQGFIVSCDMPFVTSAAIENIIAHAGNTQITLPACNGILQPLFGVYHKACLDKWEQLIREGIIKLQEMVLHFELKKIENDTDKLFQPDLLFNINNEQDFQAAVNKMKYEN